MNPEAHSGLYIKQLHDTLEKSANNSMRNQGLTMTQLSTLMMLKEFPENRAPMKELEKKMRLAQSTMAGVVKRLEQKQFVDCFGDADDKRIKLVQMTPLGEKCCRDAQKEMQKAEDNLLEGFSGEEREKFREFLRRALDNTQK